MSDAGMLHLVDERLRRLTRLQVCVLAVLLLAIVGTIDLASGYELSFSIFYVAPTALSAWYAGRRASRWLCLLAALVWLLADRAAGHVYSRDVIQYWNMSVRLGFFLIIAHLLERLRTALDQQRSLAQTDALTGLLNARAFRARCQTLFDLCARHEQDVAVAYLDLDGFKAVNDSLGHGVGDQVLRAVAATLSERLRLSDVACRMGGDEFVIVLPQTDIGGARTFFSTLHDGLCEMAASHDWPVGFSIGVAVVQGAGYDYERAIQCADGLMYRVKRSGKNKLMFERFAPAGSGVTSRSMGL